MKKMIFMCTTTFFLLLLLALSSQAQEESLLDSVVKGCEQELTTFCKDVTPGQRRLLACLYAHNDKLSGNCEFALYDAAVQLERAVAALVYSVNECADDLATHCMDVEAGEGRLLECLEKNESEVSTRCKEALVEVGLK